MIANITQQMTVDEFDEWVMQDANMGTDYEFIGGEVYDVTSNNYASETAMIIGAYLTIYVRSRNLGRVTGSDGGYRVAGERYIPDVAYISYEKQPVPSETGFSPIPPDLVVEVISDPSSAKERKKLLIKVANYLLERIVVWVVNRDDESVEVYTPNKPVQVIPVTGRLTGGDILPDFAVDVADLFPKVE
jgi:Uma2 family endonuclease